MALCLRCRPLASVNANASFQSQADLLPGVPHVAATCQPKSMSLGAHGAPRSAEGPAQQFAPHHWALRRGGDDHQRTSLGRGLGVVRTLKSSPNPALARAQGARPALLFQPAMLRHRATPTAPRKRSAEAQTVLPALVPRPCPVTAALRSCLRAQPETKSRAQRSTTPLCADAQSVRVK